MTIFEIIRLAYVYRKRLITATLSGSIVFALVLYFIFPLQFTSSGSLYPPDAQKSGGLSSLIQGADFGDLFGTGALGNPSQLLAEVLKSRSATQIVLSQNPALRKYFSAKNELELLQKIQENLSVEVTKESIIRVAFTINAGIFSRFGNEKDSVKQLVKKITESYLTALDSLNRRKLISKATRSKDFYLDQIRNTRRSIDSVSLALNEFQNKNKTISLPDQVKSAIESGAKIRAEIMSTELNLNLAEENFRPDSKMIEGLKAKLSALRLQLSQLENSGDNYLLSYGSVPGLSIQFANLTRDLKMLNELYLLLNQQFFKEQIQSNRTITTVEILDSPAVPEKESSPKLLSSVVIAGIVIFLLSLSVIVVSQKQLLLFRKVN